jgi:hypothetical protein
MHAMKRQACNLTQTAILALAIGGAVFARATPATDRNNAYRLRCELQTAGAESLDLLTWQQGTTPRLSLDQFRNGRAVDADSNGVAVVTFGPSATNTYYVTVTNYAVSGNGYLVQIPTVGTNTVAGSDWWYTAYIVEPSGYMLWTGNGRLRILRTTSTADGMTWQTISSYYAATQAWVTNQIAAATNPIPSWIAAGDAAGSNHVNSVRTELLNSNTLARAALALVEGRTNVWDAAAVLAGTAIQTELDPVFEQWLLTDPGSIYALKTVVNTQVWASTQYPLALPLSGGTMDTNAQVRFTTQGGASFYNTLLGAGSYFGIWRESTNGVLQESSYWLPSYIQFASPTQGATSWGLTGVGRTDADDNESTWAFPAISEMFESRVFASEKYADDRIAAATNGIPHSSLSGILGAGELHVSADQTNRIAMALTNTPTLQQVVTAGGTVTSGTVTIDAANARTNTFGGRLTILGRDVRAGEGNTVREYGFVAGAGNIVGEVGFGAGLRGNGARGSFVFSDYQLADFDRTAHENAFSVRASGGTYFETPMFEVSGTNKADVFTGSGVGLTDIPQSGVTGLTDALAGKSPTGHVHVVADVTGLQTALDGKANVPTISTGTVSTVSAGVDYWWTTDTNVTLSVALTSGQKSEFAHLRNSATNSILAMGPGTWRWTGGSMTNTIAAGKSMTFGFAVSALDGSTNAWATAEGQ